MIGYRSGDSPLTCGHQVFQLEPDSWLCSRSGSRDVRGCQLCVGGHHRRMIDADRAGGGGIHCRACGVRVPARLRTIGALRLEKLERSSGWRWRRTGRSSSSPSTRPARTASRHGGATDRDRANLARAAGWTHLLASREFRHGRSSTPPRADTAICWVVRRPQPSTSRDIARVGISHTSDARPQFVGSTWSNDLARTKQRPVSDRLAGFDESDGREARVGRARMTISSPLSKIRTTVSSKRAWVSKPRRSSRCHQSASSIGSTHSGQAAA